MELHVEYIDLRNGAKVYSHEPGDECCTSCGNDAIGKYLIRVVEESVVKYRLVRKHGYGVEKLPNSVSFKFEDCCDVCAPKDVPFMNHQVAYMMNNAFEKHYYGYPIEYFRVHGEDGKFYCLACSENPAGIHDKITPCRDCRLKYF